MISFKILKLILGFSFGNALKDSLFLKQSTKLLVDSSYMGNSFKQEKLDKNGWFAYHF